MAVFAKAQALVAPMVSEDAGRLEAMGKAIRKLYGSEVEPLMAHVDEVLLHARRMTDPLPETRCTGRSSAGPAVTAARPTGAARSVVSRAERGDEASGGGGSPPGSRPAVRRRGSSHGANPGAARPGDSDAGDAPGDQRPDRQRRRGSPDEHESPARAAIRGFAQSNGPEPKPPRPPTVAQTAPSVRREIPRAPAPESEIRITFEDPGGWGVL